MEETFNYKELEASWNTLDESNGGKRIPWGRPNERLCIVGNALAQHIFNNNPYGFLCVSLGEIQWHERLWDITSDYELAERVIEEMCYICYDQFSESESDLICKFLRSIEFTSTEED